MTSETTKYIGEVLDHFGQQKCSDIHLSPVRGLWFVRDKATRPYPDVTFTEAQLRELLEDVADVTRFDEAGQVDASFDLGGAYRGRLAARSTLEGVTATIRIISRDVPRVEDLGLPEKLVGLVNRPSGLVMLVGQTGSGKSTTIAAIVNKVNLEQPSSIYTLESPIEYVFPHGMSLVNQREIGVHAESFARGVENAKRSHPKIIVVGEILNADTARAVLTAAASGHVVVSTMHAGSTAEALDGLIAMFPPNEQPLIRTQLSQVLLGVVTQQLVPKTGGGMALAQEVAYNTRKIAQLILGSDLTLAEQQIGSAEGLSQGMTSMERSLALLVASGELDETVARNHSRNLTNFENELRKVQS